MNKRPDQYQLDPSEGGATDYKFRRRSEDSNHPVDPQNLEPNQAGTQTPNETMEARRQQSEHDREKELERAAGVHERGEGNHGADAAGQGGSEQEAQGDRSKLRESGAGPGSREQLDEEVNAQGGHAQRGKGQEGGSQVSERQDVGQRTGEMNVDRETARREREERETRDREELGRKDVRTRSRELQEDVQERRDREAGEREARETE